MKKVSLLALATALIAAQGASADLGATLTGTCPKAFQGFFVGGNLGYGVGTGSLKGHTTRHYTSRTVSGTNAAGQTVTAYEVRNHSDRQNARLGVHGVDGGINTGYTHRFGNWGLGLEFVASWTNASGKYRHNSVRSSSFYADRGLTRLGVVDSSEAQHFHRVKLRNSLQLRANFSYIVCNLWAPKVILGWDNSKWTRSHTVTDSRRYQNFAGGTTVTTSNNLPYSRNHSKRYNGFLWGLGVDFLATKHVIVGFEYTGTTAGKKTARYTATENNRGEISTVNRTASWKPQYNKFAVTAKVIY